MPKRTLFPSPGLICAGLLTGGSALAGAGADPVASSIQGIKGGNRKERFLLIEWVSLATGKDGCAPDQLSKAVEPGASALVDGPTGRETPKASFFVCEMSEQGKYCTG